MKNTIKNYIIIAITFLFFQNSFAQDKIYFDKKWKKTTPKNASFYRIVDKKNDTLYYVEDFYISGKLQMEGYTTNIEKDTFHGTINWYNENGSKSITRNYKKGVLHGNIIDYRGQKVVKCEYKDYKPYNGTILSLYAPQKYTTFLNGVKTNDFIYYKNSEQVAKKTDYFVKKEYETYFPIKDVFYDKNNQVIGVLNYSKKYAYSPLDGVKITFYSEDKQAVAVKSKANYKNGNLEGEIITYHKNGKKWLTGIYKDHRKYQGDFLDSYNKTSFEKGLQVGNEVKYDKQYHIVSKLSYKNGKPYDGIESKYNRTSTYSKGEIINKKEYYDSKFKIIKKITTCKNDECVIKWYDQQGKLIGTGVKKNNTPFSGTHINYDQITLYKNGKKYGIEKKFKSRVKENLTAETFYKNDTVIWKKTLNSLKNNFFHCDYKNNQPYKGVEVIYTTEKHYENAKLIKKVYYRKNNKTKKREIDRVEFFDPKERYEKVVKDVFYKDGKIYTTTFKDYVPYNGVYWRDRSAFTTYKDGKKDGLYGVLKKNQIIEEGYYVNDKRQGVVKYTPIKEKHYPKKDKTPTSCEFDNGKPINGTTSTEREITNYKNGKKHGVCTTYYYAGDAFTLKKETYNNGVKEGAEIIEIGDDKKAEGIYKNNKPYSGTFYNLSKKSVESYAEGKKHGEFITINDFWIHQSQQYNNGNLLSEKTTAKKDTTNILGSGIYKNNLPYVGTFINKLEHQLYLLETYKKGKKNGLERKVKFDYNNIENLKEISFTTYKKGKKQGDYQDSYTKIYSYQKGRVKIAGVYKNDTPYEGSFLTIKDKTLQIISTYKKGKKESYEKYISHSKTDSLLYKNGKIIEGIQIELIEKRTLKHYYKNGAKTKTTLSNKSKITYSDNGFTFNNDKFKKDLEFEVQYSNRKKTKGTVTYYQEKKSLGSLQFSEGKLINGQAELPVNKKIGLIISMKVVKNIIEISYTQENILTKLKLENKIPKTITYKDYKLLINMFMDTNTGKATVKQYLLDGTLLTKATLNGKLRIGTFIDVRTLDGKQQYSIREYDKNGERIKKINKLSFEELLEQLKIQQKKQ